MAEEEKPSHVSTSVEASQQEAKEPERSQWGNQFQFILTALGLAVGLGNIWRFPSTAYENGGAAFLIAYLCCGIGFGLPMVYAEFMMGQYSRSGPGLALGRYAAGFRGVGWVAAINSIALAVYYCVIIAWCGVYFVWVVSAQSPSWTTCGNKWNTDVCYEQKDMAVCNKNGSHPFLNFGECSDVQNKSLLVASEEFFMNYMTTRSSGFFDIGGINWPIFGAMTVLWVATCLILIFGIKIMGYLSYVIVPFPYIVVCILFGRGVTLPGAYEGIKFYILEPKWEKLIEGKTWQEALKQLMFSMNIGYGGLISLSSYSKPSNNFFRDSLIVVFGDTIMSVIGGVAIFSILGYLAEQSGKLVPDVVMAGPSLAFIAYPEAISTMSVPWLWNALFFLMLFFLGVSSEIALVETFTGMIYDCFPATKKRKWLVTVVTCSACFLLGFILVTKSGWYWFNLFDDFLGSTAACAVALFEVVILTIYGWKQIKQDMIEMRGTPRCSGIGRWFGPQSPVFAFLWATVCPALAATIAVLVLYRYITVPAQITLSKVLDQYYDVPLGLKIFGWMLNLAPILPIPIFFFYKWYKYNKQGKKCGYLFRPTMDLPSAHRYYEQKSIAEPYDEANLTLTEQMESSAPSSIHEKTGKSEASQKV